jgi:hypothetical protein
VVTSLPGAPAFAIGPIKRRRQSTELAA